MHSLLLFLGCSLALLVVILSTKAIRRHVSARMARQAASDAAGLRIHELFSRIYWKLGYLPRFKINRDASIDWPALTAEERGVIEICYAELRYDVSITDARDFVRAGGDGAALRNRPNLRPFRESMRRAANQSAR